MHGSLPPSFSLPQSLYHVRHQVAMKPKPYVWSAELPVPRTHNTLLHALIITTSVAQPEISSGRAVFYYTIRLDSPSQF